MNKAKIRTAVLPDNEHMSQYCADLIQECLEKKPNALLSLAAGMTAERTYEILVERAQKGKINFSEARFITFDEWLNLDKRAEEKNCTHFIYKHVYNPLQIPEDHIHKVDVHAEDMELECKKMDEIIFKNGGLDFVLIGIGMNGHVGLNEPGSSFGDYTKVIALSETTKTVGQKYFDTHTELTAGITMGIRHFFDAKCCVLQVAGEHKQKIMKQIYESDVTEQIPATFIKLMPTAIMVADEASIAQVEYGLERIN